MIVPKLLNEPMAFKRNLDDAVLDAVASVDKPDLTDARRTRGHDSVGDTGRNVTRGKRMQV